MRLTENENISAAINDTIIIDGGKIGNPEDTNRRLMTVKYEFVMKKPRIIEYDVRNATIHYLADGIWQNLYYKHIANKDDDAIIIGCDSLGWCHLADYCNKHNAQLCKWTVKDIILDL